MPTKKDFTSGGGGQKNQNGNRSGFRTDTAISNHRFGNERPLQPWVPDPEVALDGGLESANNRGAWDQFAANERLFGLKTDYDENIYTTSIDTSHPEYQRRAAQAERKAKEIERSLPTDAHVAEERVMDYIGSKDKDGENEEDKYSGVRRQDFPSPHGGRDNKYTPPAKRAPTGQSSTKGVPVDPAIISSQIRTPAKKTSPAPDRAQSSGPMKNGGPPSDAKPIGLGIDARPSPAAEESAKTLGASTTQTSGAAPSPNASGRSSTQQTAEAAPSATSTVERDVLNSFKKFATQQRKDAEKARSTKARADKEVKLTELKRFANSFKLATPVPSDLVSIIAKDPTRQKEIQAKAKKNAEEMAKKPEDGSKESSPSTASVSKDSQAKPSKPNPVPTPTADTRGPRAQQQNQSTPASGGPARNQAGRQPYPSAQYPVQQPYRGRGGPPPMGPPQQTGNLAQRLRHVEQNKYGLPPTPNQHIPGQDARLPPTGPANAGDGSFSRRSSGAPGPMGAKLNPNSHEFKPSPFAATFSPNGQPSAASSPKSLVNVSAEPPAPPSMRLSRRKNKPIDVKKCAILLHVKGISPPPGRNWKENLDFRPAFDTLPTWRQAKDEEKPDSTMQLTYKEWVDRQPFAGPAAATPNPGHAVPQLAHQHQHPFQVPHGGPQFNHLPRQSPHIQQMHMDGSQHGQMARPSFGNDDHRMVPSTSTSSYHSPRPGHSPLAYPGMSPSGQMPYGSPMFMNPGAPAMGPYRSYSNNQQYMPQQHGQMGSPMMMQPHFVPGPQPHMMYQGGHPQFMPSGPPSAPGANGYHSPGRPAAPMMAHQGSQQGQPMYGMSPNVQFNQPAFGHNQHNGLGQ